jgi:hypothetical protein
VFFLSGQWYRPRLNQQAQSGNLGKLARREQDCGGNHVQRSFYQISTQNTTYSPVHVPFTLLPEQKAQVALAGLGQHFPSCKTRRET